jgi:glyoxylase-like metal-dependent hydrolase (beta-lactamase superfamily II)
MLPIAINTITTGEGELIPWTIAAGEKDVSNSYIQTSFQIVYENSSIILDAPMGEKQFVDFKYAKTFFKDKHEMLQKAMVKADKLIFTHEHADHMGGLAHTIHLNSLKEKIVITHEQYHSSKINESEFPEGFLKDLIPISYTNFHQVAPGIFFIKAPGHTAGHQMIYVKLQNGIEYLFSGDIVWNYRNISKLKNRPLLATLLGGEDRKQLGQQIHWLYNIYKKGDMIIIPSHDPEIISQHKINGLLGETLNLN